MKILHDQALFAAYVEKHKLQEIFSFWGQYEAELVRYAQGERMVLVEPEKHKLFLLCSGRSKATYLTEGGREIYIASANPGALLGDLEFAGAAGAESNLELVAVTEVDCICIPIEKNRALLDRDVNFLWTIINGLVLKSKSNLRMTYTGKNFSIEAKVAGFALNSVDHGVLRPSWTAVTELLHVSYRQLMRVLGKFCDQGILERGDKLGEYRVLDRARLEEIGGELYGN